MNTIGRIHEIKKEMGDTLVILAHHYQCDDIVALSDFSGDSFELAQQAYINNAEHIVFCGVKFMAESAAVIVGHNQVVQMPDINAGCPMADMANIYDVELAWEQLELICDGDVTPIVYMNSDVEIKAFCGRNNGIVCTSSNALASLHWAFDRTEKILFLPDQHLGRNTANNMGFSPDEIIIWDPAQLFGGNNPDNIRNARVILWDGYCPVHHRFTTTNVRDTWIWNKYKEEDRLVIHPECSENVAAISDSMGSTGYIIRYVENAAPGSTIVVGTEVNLVNRLAKENPDKNIVALHKDAICADMVKTTPEKLLWTLENIGEVNIVTVPDAIKIDARKALNRMLDL